MKIHITETAADFDHEGALILSRQVLLKPDSTLGLATGDTTRGIYARAAELYRDLRIDYSRCKSCNLDEYLGVSAQDPRSCRYRIDEILLNRINLPRENTYF